MNYTDDQLKQALAKMLPDKIYYCYAEEEKFQSPFVDGEMELSEEHNFVWKLLPEDSMNGVVRDTELLQLCWEVEGKLTLDNKSNFTYNLYNLNDNFFSCVDCEDCDAWDEIFKYTHATWQQRVIALAKVLGIEIK